MKDFENRWQQILEFFKTKFTGGETPEIDTILFFIGIQELGIIKPEFSRDEKIDLMHIATCKLLEPYGYYEFTHRDDEAWPHYSRVKKIEPGIDQEQLIKEAVINYFAV